LRREGQQFKIELGGLNHRLACQLGGVNKTVVPTTQQIEDGE